MTFISKLMKIFTYLVIFFNILLKYTKIQDHPIDFAHFWNLTSFQSFLIYFMYLFVGMFSSSVLCKHKNGLEQQSFPYISWNQVECQLCSKFWNIKKSQGLITASLIYFMSQSKTLKVEKKKKKRKHAIFECEIECKIKYVSAVKNNIQPFEFLQADKLVR